MKFTINRDTMKTAVDRCKSIIDKRAAQPLLSNLLLRVEGKRLKIHGCNLREEITVELEVTEASDGAIGVDATDLSSRVGAMPEGGLSFALKPDALHVSAKSMGRKFRLATITDEDFPKLHEPSGDTLRIDAAVFGRLIAAVRHSVGTDETRQSTNSANFRSLDGALTMLSMDGHRASVISVAADLPPLTVCIPHRALLAVQSLCEDTEQIEIRENASRMFFSANGTAIAAMLPDTKFPEHYRQSLPDTTSSGLTVDRLALAESVKAVSVSSNEYNQVELRTSEGRVELSCGHDGRDSVSADIDDGFAADIACNASYLTSALQSIETPTVRILHGGKDFDGIVILPVGGDDLERMCVVMPMRK